MRTPWTIAGGNKIGNLFLFTSNLAVVTVSFMLLFVADFLYIVWYFTVLLALPLILSEKF